MDEIRIIQPKVSGAWKMPNVGLNDVIDLMDFFGYELEIKIKPRESRMNDIPIKESSGQ